MRGVDGLALEVAVESIGEQHDFAVPPPDAGKTAGIVEPSAASSAGCAAR